MKEYVDNDTMTICCRIAFKNEFFCFVVWKCELSQVHQVVESCEDDGYHQEVR